MKLDSSENYNIKTRMGSLVFDIFLDATFLSADAPSRSNRHNHSMIEIHFILSGSGTLLFNHEAITMRPNHFYVIPAGVYHAVLSDQEQPLGKYTFRFDYAEMREKESYYPFDDVELLKQALNNIQYVGAQDRDGNIDILQQIISELELRPIGYYAKLQAGFNQILVNVLRSNSSLSTSSSSIPNRMSDEQRSHIIDQYFDQYQLDLTLEHLSQLLHLSTRQTNRIIKKLYNTTFSDKLVDIRIEEAKDQLMNSNASITILSQQLGFASPSFFSTLFKRQTGMTPHVYRKVKRFIDD